MITLIAAAAVAAAQPTSGPATQQAPMMQMGAGHEQHGQMAEMKDCCCKEMMSRMHEGHHVGNDGPSGQ